MFSWVSKSVFIMLLFYSSFSWSQQAVLDPRKACAESVQQVSADTLENISPGNIIDVCSRTPIQGDLSVQILLYFLGEPFLMALNMWSIWDPLVFTVDDSGASKTFASMHGLLEFVNWAAFVLLVIYVSIVFFMQKLRWGSGTEQTMTFKKWFKLNGLSMTTSMLLSAPIFGWMTALQFIGISFVVFFVFLAKKIVVFIFLSSFFSQTASSIVTSVRPNVEAEIAETTLLYYCDIQNREDLISGMIAYAGTRDRVALEGMPLFQCLTSSSGATVVNPAQSSSDGNRYDVSLRSISQTKQCWDANRTEALKMGLSGPKSCGSVSLNTPKPKSGSDSVIESAKTVYLSELMHDKIRQVSVDLYEYMCRSSLLAEEAQFSNSPTGCSRLSISGAGYRYDWGLDPSTGSSVLFRYSLPMDVTSKVQAKQRIAQSKGSISSEMMDRSNVLTQHLGAMLSASDTGDFLPVDEGSATDLAVRMERGGWLSGSLFFRNVSGNMDSFMVMSQLSRVYDVSPSSSLGYQDLSPILGGDAGIVGDPVGAAVRSIVPSFNLFSSHRECWSDLSKCTPVAINPFVDMGKEGTRLVGEGILYYLGAKIVNVVVKKIMGVNKKDTLMIMDSMSLIYGLYILLGIFLLLVIPAYPLFILAGSLVNWAYDMLLGLLVLQMNLVQSPLSKQSKSAFSEKVRESFMHIVGLSGYFIAIMVAVLMLFVSVSFFYAMNALIVGWLFSMSSWAGIAHSVEGVVIKCILDALLVFIIFYEVKLCTPLLQKIPAAYLEKFKISMSHTENMGEAILRNFRQNVLPSVSQFIGGGKV